MINVFDLVKIYFKEMFISRKNNKNNPTLIILGIITILYGIMFTGLFIGYIDQINTLEFFPIDKVLYPFLGLNCIGSLMFSILAGNKLTLTKKDLSVLTPLPISDKVVVNSKILFALIVESFFNIFLAICYAIAYSMSGEVTLNGYIIIFFVCILSNVLPISTISVLVLLIHNAISKSKYNYMLAKIESIVSIIIVLAFSLSYSFIMNYSSEDIEPMFKVFNVYEKIITYYPFMNLIKLGIETGKVYYTLIYVLIHIVIAVIFYFLFSKFAYRLMINQINYGKDTRLTKIEYKEKDFNKTLLKRESKIMFGNSIYSMNMLISPILFTIMSIVMMFVFDKETLNMMYYFEFIFFNMFLCICVYTPVFTPSIDYKYDWILKSLPVREKDIFKNKIIFNMIIILIPNIIISMMLLIVSIINSLSIIYPILLFIFIFVFSLLTSLTQLLIGLKYPDLTDDIQHKVKQSKAVSISMGLGFLYLLIFGAIYVFGSLILKAEISLVIVILCTLIVGFIVYRRLKIKGLEYYNNFY